ncbi:MAG: hypothetical protein ACRC1M_07050 [Methanobacteriaceae archaeon]
MILVKLAEALAKLIHAKILPETEILLLLILILVALLPKELPLPEDRELILLLTIITSLVAPTK